MKIITLKFILIALLLTFGVEAFACSPIVCGYIKKRDRLFFNVGDKMSAVKGASARFFRLLKSEHGYDYQLYGRDNSSVFHCGRKMEGADAGSFKFLGGSRGWGLNADGYGMDKNSAYFEGMRIEGVDINTFQHLGYTIAKDKNHVYNSGKRFGDFDADSFQLISEDYYKDKTSIYYGIEPLVDSNPMDYELWECYIKSNGNIYIYGGNVKLDAKTFDVAHILKSYDSCDTMTIEGAVIKDETGIYYQNMGFSSAGDILKLDTFDTATFKYRKMVKAGITQNTIFEDKNGMYIIHKDYWNNKPIVKKIEDENNIIF